ncbi:MAG: ammonium transporter [Methylococcales bacterium]|nr:ammonium transporter [Methylococcales bacterium]
MKKFLDTAIFSLVATGFWPTLAYADQFNAADTAWILTASGLVLFMTVPGLALFYGGLVRTKNVLSIMMKCFAITSVVSVLWLLGGYSLALSDGGSWQALLGGFSKLTLATVNAHTVKDNLPETVFCMYHLTFAIFAPALIIGGVAERMKFSALLWFVALWEILIYVPVCHWIWGGGWLSQLGVMDFAGGIVVHTTGGVAAMIGAIMVGARHGFPRVPMPPHNLTMTATGAGVLWVGWHGFSAGSALMANGSAGIAMLSTHMSAAAGSLAWMTIEWFRFGKPSVLGLLTGLVAGLGMIAPSAGFVSPLSGLVIGLIAGCVCFFSLHAIKRRLAFDDTLDVFAIHGVGGIIGSLLTAIFASEALGGIGQLADDGISGQLLAQAIAVLSVLVWSGLMSYAILKLVDKTIGLRVGASDESLGLDISLHNEQGYNY